MNVSNETVIANIQMVRTSASLRTYVFVGADDNATKVSVHHLGTQSPQSADQLLEQLGHEAVDDPVQQRVTQQAIAVAAQVAVHGGEDGVRDAGDAGFLRSDACRRSSAYFFDALGDHCLENAKRNKDNEITRLANENNPLH